MIDTEILIVQITVIDLIKILADAIIIYPYAVLMPRINNINVKFIKNVFFLVSFACLLMMTSHYIDTLNDKFGIAKQQTHEVKAKKHEDNKNE